MPTDFFGRVMVVFQRYGMSMLQGAGVSLRIALVGTIVGCIIGFAVGIVQTIPVEAKDNPMGDQAHYECLRGIFPRYPDDGAGHVHLLWYASAFRLKLKHVAGSLLHSVHQYRCLYG